MLVNRFGFRPMFFYNPEGDGGAGAAGGGAADPNKNGDGSGGDKGDEKKFTQQDVDRIFSERLGRAVASEQNKLLESLGMKSADDLKTALGDFKKLREAQLSELEKAQQAAKDAQAKIDAAEKAKADALAHAQQKLLRAAVSAEAVKQNFDEAEISSVWLALQTDKKLSDTLKASDDGETFAGVDKAVEQIAKAHPKWLKSAAASADINARNRNDKKGDGDPKQREEELKARFRLN